MLKNTLCITLFLFTVSCFAMESQEPMQAASNFELLPPEILAYILPYVGHDLEQISKSLQALRLTNSHLKGLIDDQRTMWNLVKFLSKKFNVSPLYIVSHLKIPLAKDYTQKLLGYFQQTIEFEPHYETAILKNYLTVGNDFIVFLYRSFTDPETAKLKHALIIARISPNGSIDKTFGDRGSIYIEDNETKHFTIGFPIISKELLNGDIALAYPSSHNIILNIIDRTGETISYLGETDNIDPIPHIRGLEIYNVICNDIARTSPTVLMNSEHRYTPIDIRTAGDTIILRLQTFIVTHDETKRSQKIAYLIDAFITDKKITYSIVAKKIITITYQ